MIAWAVAMSPRCQASCRSAQARGATFEVTEMQPCPPWAKYGKTVASSPESCAKSSPMAMAVSAGRTRSAVASLTPTMFGSSASRAMVSTDMSITLRPGML